MNLEKRLDHIENEIKSLKSMVLFRASYKPKKPVSFRGLARTKLSEKELDEFIEKSKKSLFHNEEL